MKLVISRLSIAVAGLGSLLMFAWPLFISQSSTSETQLAQTVFIVLMPLTLLLILV